MPTAPKLHHPKPAGLAKAGGALWCTIASKYALRPDELVVLEDACRTSDMIAELDADWAEDGRPKTSKGSMGQKVIHPLIGELRAQRAVRARLLAQLKLPDLDGEAGAEGTPPVNQNRAAAKSSWAPGAARNRGA